MRPRISASWLLCMLAFGSTAHAASTPARLTLGEESIEELIEVPDDMPLGRYKVRCEGMVLPNGEAGQFNCYSDQVHALLIEATARAVREAKFTPATVNGKKLGVYMSLMVIIQITKDKDDPLVLAVPNNGADADRYGLFYSAPQRYNSFRWRPDRFITRLRKDLRIFMNASVDEHGKVTQHSVTNVFGATPQLLEMLDRRIETMKFIPGYFHRKPAPMRYAELIFPASLNSLEDPHPVPIVDARGS